MSVSDNGKGMSVPVKKGIGLSAMEEFAARQKGSIIIQGSDRGFKITAAIPLASPLASTYIEGKNAPA
jgi:signal transduction histidine kinase